MHKHLHPAHTTIAGLSSLEPPSSEDAGTSRVYLLNTVLIDSTLPPMDPSDLIEVISSLVPS